MLVILLFIYRQTCVFAITICFIGSTTTCRETDADHVKNSLLKQSPFSDRILPERTSLSLSLRPSLLTYLNFVFFAYIWHEPLSRPRHAQLVGIIHIINGQKVQVFRRLYGIIYVLCVCPFCYIERTFCRQLLERKLSVPLYSLTEVREMEKHDKV